MVYAGAVAAGAFAGQSVTLFGHEFASGSPAYVAMATAGTIGYLLGSIGGWALGDYLGRPWLERHGRWLHLDAAKLDRAERWFDRWEDWAVFLGRVTPVVALVHLDPGRASSGALRPYVWLTLLGSAIWCFAFAGAGWAAGATGSASTTPSSTSSTSSRRRSSAQSRCLAGAPAPPAAADETV